MKDIILIGSGGCMREIAWQLQQCSTQQWNIAGYIDSHEPEEDFGILVGKQKIPYLGGDDVLLQKREPVNAAVCVGEPALRKKIVQKLKKNEMIQFPGLILGHTEICEDVSMGEGVIVSMDVRVSTNVRLGNFVFLNIGSMVCHDGCIGDFTTLSPDVKLAGNVSVGTAGNIGIGTRVIQGISIGNSVVTGAGSVIVRDVEDNCTVAGVPAGKIRG